MSTTLDATSREEIVKTLGALVNGGTAEVWTGPRPATVATAPAGTKLATIGLAGTAFAAGAVDGTVTLNTVTPDPSADASGTPAFVRFFGSSGQARFDVKASGPGGGGDIIFDVVPFVATAPISISSFTLAIGAGTAD